MNWQSVKMSKYLVPCKCTINCGDFLSWNLADGLDEFAGHTFIRQRNNNFKKLRLARNFCIKIFTNYNNYE